MTAEPTIDLPYSVAQATLLPGDATVENVRVLDLAQIGTYEHNPRLLRNAKLPQIKEAIRASGGLTEPISVTQRPGEDGYIVHQGGNTRIQALLELAAETNNPAFRSVPVTIQPYVSEIELAALHDRENTCRGDLSFFEEAWSKYRQWKLYLEHDLGDPKAAAFVRYLNGAFGASLTTHRFSRMRFAVETLYQHIPTCLVQGAMSQKSVRELKSTENTLRQIWTDRRLGTEGEFEEVFFSLLARQDKNLADSFISPDADPSSFPDHRISIDWRVLEEDFSYELTIVADIDFQEAEAWIAEVFRPCGKAAEQRRRPPTSAADAAARDEHQSDTRPLPPSILELRALAFRSAQRVAEGTVVADCISPTPNRDLGYALEPLPSHSAVTACSAATWAILAMSAGLPNITMAPAITVLEPQQLRAWSKLIQTVVKLTAISAEDPSLPTEKRDPANAINAEEPPC